MEPIRRFDAQSYSDALEAWGWLDGLAGMTPALANAFGDLFLQSADGSFSFLSTLDGKLQRVWPNAAALQEAINTPAAQQEYLLVGLVQDAFEAGLDPGPGQVLAFTVPPALGGEVAVDNLTLADFVVTVNLAGQIHEQIRDLPPGYEYFRVHDRLTFLPLMPLLVRHSVSAHAAVSTARRRPLMPPSVRHGVVRSCR